MAYCYFAITRRRHTATDRERRETDVNVLTCARMLGPQSLQLAQEFLLQLKRTQYRCRRPVQVT